MFAILGIITIIFPILGVFFSTLGLIFSEKNKTIYSILISISLATLAYLYIPPYTDDLYRHHITLLTYTNMNFGDFFSLLSSDFEKIPLLFYFIISKFNRVNLLQFTVTFFTYCNIFYLINKFYKKGDSIFKYFIILMFTFFSFAYLGIISNLWFMLASSIFCIGIYKDYVENNNKSAILYYILALFTHSSIIFSLSMLMLFKFFKHKISLKLIIILVIGFSSMGIILKYLSSNYDIAVFKLLYEYYVPYFENTKFIEDMHPLKLMIIYLIKITPYILIYIFNKNLRNNQLNKISIYFSIIVLVLYGFSSFSVRFIPIVQLSGIPLLSSSFEEIKKGKRYNMFFILLIIIITGIWFIFNVWQARNFNFYDLYNSLLRNIILIIESRI